MSVNMNYYGERMVYLNGVRKCVPVEMTEKAILERPDHVYRNGQVYWVYNPGDELGWKKWKDFCAVKVVKQDWDNAREC